MLPRNFLLLNFYFFQISETIVHKILIYYTMLMKVITHSLVHRSEKSKRNPKIKTRQSAKKKKKNPKHTYTVVEKLKINP